MSRFVIAPMREDDLGPVAEMEAQVFSDAWSKAAFEEEFSSPLSTLYTAKQEGKLAGYLILRCIFDEGEIINVAVDPQYRRHGCGRLLLQATFEQAKREGLSVLMLEVRRSNLAAIRLYENFGFVIVGERKGYYEKPKEDALLMTCFLSDSDVKIEGNGKGRISV